VVDDANTVATRETEIVLASYATTDAQTVLDALGDEDPRLRARALSSAERLGLRTVARRVAALRDDAVQVRRVASQLEARFPRDSQRVASALLARLSDDDALVVVSSCEALGEMGRVDAIDGLSDTARSHDDARCREAAVAALGTLGDPAGLEAIFAALEDKPAIRRRAVVALAAFEGPAVDAALSSALEDRDWQVRQAAEALLGADGTA
jgi:HEAT repeat protein